MLFRRLVETFHPELEVIKRYDPGEFMPEHFDGEECEMSLLNYLNTVEEGGEILFPDLNIQFVTTKGMSLLWFNNHYNRTPKLEYHHQARKVISGEKYLGITLFRYRTSSEKHQIIDKSFYAIVEDFETGIKYFRRGRGRGNCSRQKH